MRSAAEIGETEGIRNVNADHIISVGIGSGTGTAITDHTHPIERSGFIHIKDCTVNGNLLGSSLERTQGNEGEENRFSEICVKTDQTALFKENKYF